MVFNPFVKIPQAPKIEDYGLTEEQVKLIHPSKIELGKKEKAREDNISILSFILTFLLIGFTGYCICIYKGKAEGIKEIIFQSFGYSLLTFMATIPFYVYLGLSNWLIGLLYPKVRHSKVDEEINNKYIDYQKALTGYRKSKAIFDKTYPLYEEFGSREKYIEMLYNELKANLKQEIIAKDRRNNKACSAEWWKRLSWRKFEEEVANWFSMQGYRSEVTQASNDGGYDVLIERDGEKALVQCKHYKNQIGVEIVRELYGIMSAYKIPKGYIVCLDGGLTTEARKFLGLTSIEVITLQDLIINAKSRDIYEYEQKYCYTIDNYWVKKEFISKEFVMQRIKSGAYDEFYSKIKFQKKKIIKAERSLFDKEEIEYHEPYYGMRRVSKQFPFYSVVYSTKEDLEKLDIESEIFDRSTKSLHNRNR